MVSLPVFSMPCSLHGGRCTKVPGPTSTGSPFSVTVAAHVNAARLSTTPEHLRVLRKAWDARFAALRKDPSNAGQGKTYTATMYGCAEAVGLLAQHQAHPTPDEDLHA